MVARVAGAGGKPAGVADGPGAAREESGAGGIGARAPDPRQPGLQRAESQGSHRPPADSALAARPLPQEPPERPLLAERSHGRLSAGAERGVVVDVHAPEPP